MRCPAWFLLAAFIFAPAAMGHSLPGPDDFNIDAYKGKVVYLDFWASWCGPCKLSFPYMNHLTRLFPGNDLVIVADNLDKESAKAQSFLRQFNTQVPVIFDNKGVLATRFNIHDMPTAILIGRDGKVRYVHRGFFKDKEAEYTSHIFKLVNEKTP